MAVAPPFTALSAAAQALQGSSISVAAQDVFWAESGAYTGEISPKMLADAGCRLGIVGHSERRQYFHETDESVNKKAAALIKEGLIPIVCLGETLAERQGGLTFAGRREADPGRAKGAGSVKDSRRLVIAYEPVWAIGTGQTATPEQAQEVQAFIRKLVGRNFFVPPGPGDPHPLRRERKAREHRRAHGHGRCRRRPGRRGEPGRQVLCPDRQRKPRRGLGQKAQAQG